MSRMTSGEPSGVRPIQGPPSHVRATDVFQIHDLFDLSISDRYPINGRVRPSPYVEIDVLPIG